MNIEYLNKRINDVEACNYASIYDAHSQGLEYLL